MTQSWNDPTNPKPTETFGGQPRYGEEQGTADKAKQEGRQLADTTQQQAKDVKDTAAGEASALKDTAKAEAGDVKDVASAHAQGLKDQAVDAGQQVTETAKLEAQQVVGEARDHIFDLVENVRGEARGRAADAQVAVAGTLAGLTDELGRISRGETTDGPVSQFVGQLHGRGQELGDWLQVAEPEDVVYEVRRFAARRPVAFLAIAAGAGMVVGRLARGAKAAADDQHELEERRRQYRRPVAPQDYQRQGYQAQGYQAQGYQAQQWVDQGQASGPGYAAQPVGHPAIDSLTTSGPGYAAQAGTRFEDTIEPNGSALDPRDRTGQLGSEDRFGDGQGLR